MYSPSGKSYKRGGNAPKYACLSARAADNRRDGSGCSSAAARRSASRPASRSRGNAAPSGRAAHTPHRATCARSPDSRDTPLQLSSVGVPTTYTNNRNQTPWCLLASKTKLVSGSAAEDINQPHYLIKRRLFLMLISDAVLFYI